MRCRRTRKLIREIEEERYSDQDKYGAGRKEFKEGKEVLPLEISMLIQLTP
jgi:hypothetical protein